MQKNVRPRREFPIMIGCSATLAVSIVLGYNRYTSPDRIEEKPLLDVSYDAVEENPVLVSEMDNFFQKELLQAIEPQHSAPNDSDYMKKLDTVCYVFGSLCEKITFIDNGFDAKNRYLYTSIPVYLMHYLDSYGTANRLLADVVSRVLVSPSDGRRGYANHDMVTINTNNIKSVREYTEVLTHEMGHIMDLGAVTGTMKRKNKQYTEFGQEVFSLDDPSIDYYKLSRMNEKTRRMGQTRNDFCSGYGQQTPFEDFAECANLYLNHHDFFKHLTQRSTTLYRKYTYLKKLFDGFYIYRDTQSIQKHLNPYEFSVFDTSRIS